MDFSTEWARCSAWIEDALAYCGGTHDIEDVREAIERGEAQFWPGERSAIVTQVDTFPRLRALSFWLAGGDLTEITERMRPVIEAWGRELGCTRFTVPGRPGWARVLKAHGYAPAWSICSKDIPDE